MASDTPLLATDAVVVRDLRCAAPRGGCGGERGGERSHLALLRHGGFGYHPGRRRYLGDPTTALFHHADRAYRISHPLDGGDRCTVIECTPALEEEAFGAEVMHCRQVAFTVDPRTQTAHLVLWRQLADGNGDQLAGEECVLELLARLRRLSSPLPCRGRARPRLQQQVDQVRQLLAARLSDNLGAGAIAAEVELSPFHLMRSFRALTGQSLRGYRQRLRLAAALERLAGGCEDLTALALDLGFASHSHLDAAFRQELGQPPAAWRRCLQGSAEAERRSRPSATRNPRTFLQVGPGCRR